MRCPTDSKKLPVAGPQYSPSSYTSSSSFLCRPSPHLSGSYRCPSTPSSTQASPQPVYGISTPGYVSTGSPYTSGSAGRSPGSSDRSSPLSSILGGSFSDSFNFSSRVRPMSSLADTLQLFLVTDNVKVSSQVRPTSSLADSLQLPLVTDIVKVSSQVRPTSLLAVSYVW